MAHEVTVALVGTTSYFERFPSQDERQRPYADRPKATVTVEDDEPLGQVIRRARPALGIDESLSPGFVGFYQPADEDGLTSSVSGTVTLVDDEGRAVWGTWWPDVSFREIVRAGEAGVLGGDPLRPYTALKAPIGDGMLPDWQQLEAFLEIGRTVLQVMGEVGGAVGLIELLRGRFSKAPEVIEANGPGWAARGGSPFEVAKWLDRRPWHPADVGDALACSRPEAEALLWAFGFAESGDGLFRRGEDEVATAMSETLKSAFTGQLYMLSEAEKEELVRRTAERLQRDGRVPVSDESGWPWFS